MAFQRNIKGLAFTAFLGLALASFWISGFSPRSGLKELDRPQMAPRSVPEGQDSEVSSTSPTKSGATYLKLIPLQTAARVYELESLAVDTDGFVPNPFDPAQMDIEVRFESPSGGSVTVSAFWYQDFDPLTLKARGKPGWRARFTPSSPGQWTAQASLAGTPLHSQVLKFRVAEDAQGPGFVGLNRQNPRYLAFEDGSFFYPIGLNMAWSTGSVLQDYQRWMDLLSQNGGNFIRVWMSSRSFGLEWKDTGLGNYTARLRQAWLLDQVFDLARQDGIYILLDLINHGAFSTQADAEWAYNPYNAALGGPCQEPQDFATDPLAQEYFSRRLRYIAARWAYSPNLMAWEWWNEVDWTPIRDDLLKPWIQKMTAVLTAYDPYRHLISSSYRGGINSDLWSMPELSFAQVHDYSGSDPMLDFPPIYQKIQATAPNKPALVSEYGNPRREDDENYAGDGVHLHNGLWAAPFSGFASTAMYWWWDLYIDPYNLWSQFRGIADFLKGENLASLHLDAGEVSSGEADARVLQGEEHALVWVRSSAYTMNARRNTLARASLFLPLVPDGELALPLRRSLSLTLQDLKDGAYQAYWFSPQSDAWIRQDSVVVKNGQVTLPIPDFDRDLALKLVKKP